MRINIYICIYVSSDIEWQTKRRTVTLCPSPLTREAHVSLNSFHIQQIKSIKKKFP